MIELVLAHTDLARVRFAHSPARELVASLLALQNRTQQVMHGRWLVTVRPRLGGPRLELLTALAPTGRYLPAFLLPPPTRPWEELADELEIVAATPPAVVRAELEAVYLDRPLPAVLRPLYEDPPPSFPPSSGSCGATGTPRSGRCGSGCARSAGPT